MEMFRSGFDVNCTCRCCLSSCVELEPIIMSGLEEQIWECASIRILADDGLPTGLCPGCRSDLCIALSFRSRCRQSDTILRHIFNNYDQIHVDVKNVPKSSFSSAGSPDRLEQHDDAIDPDRTIKVEVDIKYEEEFSNNSNHSIVPDSETQKKFNKRNEKKYPCSICSKLLSSKGSLQYHVKNMHGAKRKTIGNVTGWGISRRFNCTECTYSSRRNKDLVYHMRTHTGEKPLQCDLCTSRFAQPGALISHRKIHSDKMYFTCDQCGKQFKHKYKYNKHKLVHTRSRKYICDICNKELRSKETLIGHLNRHYNIKNFSCEKCGALFVTKVELLNHSKKHADEKKYSCDFCEFRSYLKTGLEKHLMRHIGQRPFKCDLCEMSCYTKDELKCHKRKHTKEKNYSCPVCEVKFSHSSGVNKHMLKIHSIKYNRLNIVDRRTVK